MGEREGRSQKMWDGTVVGETRGKNHVESASYLYPVHETKREPNPELDGLLFYRFLQVGLLFYSDAHTDPHSNQETLASFGRFERW